MGVINAFKRLIAGNKPLSTDVNQLIDVFSGNADIGLLSLPQPIANPSAPTVAVNTSAGVLNGNYQYIQVNVTGWVGSDGTFYVNGFAPSVASATVSPANQQVNVTLTVGPTGTIARALYRPIAGGTSYKFVHWVANDTDTTWTDNTADAYLGTGMPTVSGTAIPASVPTINTTGTTLKYIDYYSQTASNLGNNTVYTKLQYKRPDGTLYMESDLSNPDGNGNYQTDTWTFYDTNGTTVLATHVWSLTWDGNGKVTQKVMTS